MTERVKKVIAQKETLEPDAYAQKLDKEKRELQARLRETKSELKDVQTKHQLLKAEGLAELPEIGLEREWVQFYQAWNGLLLSQRGRTAAEADLVDFHKQIAEKLTKQTTRLRKLQQYSVQLKANAASKHATKSSHRIRRIEKVKEILAKFETKMDAEKQRSYDARIAKENQVSQELSDQLESLHRENLEIEATRKTLQETTRQKEEEVKRYEEDVNTKLSKFKQTFESLKKTNGDLQNRVTQLNDEHLRCQDELSDLDAILESAKMLLESVTRAETLAEAIHV